MVITIPNHHSEKLDAPCPFPHAENPLRPPRLPGRDGPALRGRQSLLPSRSRHRPRPHPPLPTALTPSLGTRASIPRFLPTFSPLLPPPLSPLARLWKILPFPPIFPHPSPIKIPLPFPSLTPAAALGLGGSPLPAVRKRHPAAPHVQVYGAAESRTSQPMVARKRPPPAALSTGRAALRCVRGGEAPERGTKQCGRLGRAALCRGRANVVFEACP